MMREGDNDDMIRSGREGERESKWRVIRSQSMRGIVKLKPNCSNLSIMTPAEY